MVLTLQRLSVTVTANLDRPRLGRFTKGELSLEMFVSLALAARGHRNESRASSLVLDLEGCRE